MRLPNLTAQDVKELLPNVSDVGDPMNGGQKLVFPCTIEGNSCVVKFLIVNQPEGVIDGMEEEGAVIAARAKREVEIMRKCDTPHLVKLGPISLTNIEHKGESLIYFSEEFVEGEDLLSKLRESSSLPILELISLGKHINCAIEALWSRSKIHRDIKPENIMRRSSNGDFVLLDMGYAFDLGDVSLSSPGAVPGTPRYFSPERIELASKRQMDFRSDHFSLGVVMYFAATGIHPFYQIGMSDRDVLAAILFSNSLPPSNHRTELPGELDAIIMRLMSKRPHLRYRTCQQLDLALTDVEQTVQGGL